MSNDTKRADLLEAVNKVRAEHERIFGEELVIGELNHFFTSLLEFKRRKWIEASLADNSPEDIILILEGLDAEQGAEVASEGNPPEYQNTSGESNE